MFNSLPKWVLFALIQGYLVAGASYSYDDSAPNGTCQSGKFQSPINIDTSRAVRGILPLLDLTTFIAIPSLLTVTNTGSTIQVDPSSQDVFRVSGGPLNGNYRFAQFHIHWGPDNSVGSESTVNGRSYAAELHMVCYKEEYGTIANALTKLDGLAVLSTFIEGGAFFDNFSYGPLIEAARRVTTAGSSVTSRAFPSLLKLMPFDRTSYYTWYGSLTTPECAEIVRWIQFDTPVRLSNAQLAVLRTLRDSSGNPILKNNRPVQDLNGRLLQYARLVC